MTRSNLQTKTTAKLHASEWGAAHRKSKMTCISALLCLSISATHVVTELVNINAAINSSVAAHHDDTKTLLVSQTTTSATICIVLIGACTGVTDKHGAEGGAA